MTSEVMWYISRKNTWSDSQQTALKYCSGQDKTGKIVFEEVFQETLKRSEAIVEL